MMTLQGSKIEQTSRAVPFVLIPFEFSILLSVAVFLVVQLIAFRSNNSPHVWQQLQKKETANWKWSSNGQEEEDKC